MTLLELMVEARKSVARAEGHSACSYLCLALDSFYTDDETRKQVDLLIKWIRMQLAGCYTFEGYFNLGDQYLRHERLQWIDAMIQHLKLNDELNEKTLSADILGSMVMSGELPKPNVQYYTL